VTGYELIDAQRKKKEEEKKQTGGNMKANKDDENAKIRALGDTLLSCK